MAESPYSIQVKSVDVCFGRTFALRNLTLDIIPGERLAVVGESGAGKTTLLAVIAGLIRPSRGRIFLRESDITDSAPSERSIGFVFQSDALFPHMTVFENVAFPLWAKKRPSNLVVERVNGLLAQVELSEYRSRLPRMLSGGQRQRVALARALAVQPSILLFDEPLANLDTALRRRLRELLLELHKTENFTLLMVTHDPEEACEVGQRIAVIKQGELVAVESGRRLYWTPPTQYVADLFGPCNTLNGHASASGDVITLTVLGHTFRVPRNMLPDAIADGCGTLLVRPDAVSISERNQGLVNDGSNWQFGRVVASRDSGRVATIRVALDCDRQELEVFIPNETDGCVPPLGSQICWQFKWNRVHWIPGS